MFKIQKSLIQPTRYLRVVTQNSSRSVRIYEDIPHKDNGADELGQPVPPVEAWLQRLRAQVFKRGMIQHW